MVYILLLGYPGIGFIVMFAVFSAGLGLAVQLHFPAWKQLATSLNYIYIVFKVVSRFSPKSVIMSIFQKSS